MNFTTSMPDANYATIGSANVATPNRNIVLTPASGASPAVGSVRIATTVGGAGSYNDCEFVFVGIFR